MHNENMAVQSRLELPMLPPAGAATDQIRHLGMVQVVGSPDLVKS